MNLKYFTSLPHGHDGLKIAHNMVLKGFPILFKDNGKGIVNLYTHEPEEALQWIFDYCDDWAQIEFTSYYNEKNEDIMDDIQKDYK